MSVSVTVSIGVLNRNAFFLRWMLRFGSEHFIKEVRFMCNNDIVDPELECVVDNKQTI
jgi:hypothetical protein